MTPATLNLPDIEKGATYRHKLTWYNPDKTLVNLTGCSAKMQVRKDAGASTLLLELSTQNGGLVLGGVSGTIDIFVSDEDTAGFTWGPAIYDLFINQPNGDRIKLCKGSWSVKPSITQ